MCFYISEKNPDALIAKKNIKVYKFLYSDGENLQSPYYSYFNWNIGKLEQTEIYVTKDKTEILNGFHAFTTKHKALHCSTRLTLSGCELFEMTIPKGATYYINKDDKEIVSNQMIYVNDMTKTNSFKKTFE
jgi:hypothetical protein